MHLADRFELIYLGCTYLTFQKIVKNLIDFSKKKKLSFFGFKWFIKYMLNSSMLKLVLLIGVPIYASSSSSSSFFYFFLILFFMWYSQVLFFLRVNFNFNTVKKKF